MKQCPSCGGFCGTRCQRADFNRALNSAVYWQNRCCDLEEIIELFCMDAEFQHDCAQSTASIILEVPYQLDVAIA